MPVVKLPLTIFKPELILPGVYADRCFNGCWATLKIAVVVAPFPERIVGYCLGGIFIDDVNNDAADGIQYNLNAVKHILATLVESLTHLVMSRT